MNVRAVPLGLRVAFLFLLTLAGLASVSALPAAEPAAPPPLSPAAAEKGKMKPLEMVVFEKLLDRHQDMTYDQLMTAVYKDRKYPEKLSFDPTKAAYFDRVADKLQMTKEERAIFEKTGFVSVDQKQRYSFASAYYQIYARDLPVLVTSDSIMHALHRSYDDILMELEQTYFTWTVGQILDDCRPGARRQGRRQQGRHTGRQLPRRGSLSDSGTQFAVRRRCPGNRIG